MPSRLAALTGALARAPRRLGARAPLRVKLVALLLLLVAVALAGSGAAASTTLRTYLVGRIDSQLSDAQHPIVEHGLAGTLRGSERGGGALPGGSSGSATDRDSVQDRLPSAYVVEVTDSRGTPVYGPTNALVDTTQPLPDLPSPTGAATRARGAHTFTVDAVEGTTQWRVLAEPVILIDGSTGTLFIAQSLRDVQSTVAHLIVLLVVIGAAAVVVLGGVGYLVVRRSLRPLRDVERTAAQIAAGDLSHRVPETADPRTEVGGLSVALNSMLGQIETAFAARAASESAARASEQRMRRFVADASHELRTPLTTIRGFAELYRHGAATDPAELSRLMRRIEDEAKRMGLLVEDLLTLARLDQQRPLARLPVDLLALARDAVSDARAVAPERPISLLVGPTDPPPVVIGDDARLRQVLANLIGNALQHTPADAAVTVRIGTVPGERTGAQVVRLSVEDAGPGLSTEDAERVFERFYRADAARDRRDGGSGLGLSIVAALVAGHGGTVDVDSTPGVGVRFVVELPLAGDAPIGAPGAAG
ncbi:HAMP domain-containing histidine kinase [Jatrophihabitans cynanchi]|jgi:two-component system OmpR family sensor kinase|uniref:histidine kinase n=1 Tax=Jatrophihabitans cynanchi TaxID=2944128 RepID=A0ABY7K0N9_9ACTN|nr:HAMP domain-containing sensor histidine kinase [Jatrophihabitans sp. SB3-54]WAX57157.1 HAMP domain-containing histidine kinase [Jatrophihabitans sp. SB3-54]